MNATINASRAVATEFARRLYVQVLRIGALVTIVLLAGGAYLTTLSSWWWVLQVALLFWAAIFVIIMLLARFVMKLISMPLSKEQKSAVGLFVDKLERISGALSTPKFMILLSIIRDGAQRRSSRFIEQTTNDSKLLHSDFLALTKLFM